MMSHPFILKTIFSVAACKLVRQILRLKGSGGTALPGKVAMALEKNILEVVSRGMEIIVVTGTNGKTTTCRMLEHAFTSSGKPCLSNKSGANLLSGVTAELTCSADWMGRPRTHYAVIECDEGALKQVVPLIHPKVILVTNLFRDQLDRYGEVMHTLDAIRAGVQKVPETILCLNADCSLTASLAEDVTNHIEYYGLDMPVGDQKDVEISDAKYCIRCGTQYSYDYHTYAHLGGFCCPSCGYRRMRPQTAITEIIGMTSQGTDVKIRLRETEHRLRVGIPAVYNLYNAAAAICAYRAFGLNEEEILSSIADVRSSFGRMESFRLGEVPLQMILVKNPAGCNQSLEYITGLGQDYGIVFCLNDKTADGHDISWIWDADFEKIVDDPRAKWIVVSGERAEDMQLRLKYAGADESRIRMEKDYEKLIEDLKSSEVPIFILPNYTSMLSLRQVLSEATGAQAFWKG